MRLTLLVTSFAILIASSVGAVSGNQSRAVLDLTRVPLSQRTPLGVPGQHVGGVPGDHAPIEYRLPLDIRVMDAHQLGAVVRVELAVQNRDRSTFELPSCTDQRKAHLGARHRRTFEFGFEFTDKHHRPSELADVTYGGTPGCSIALQPGATAAVIVNVSMPPGLGGVAADTRLLAICREVTLEDESLEVAATSRPVRSPAASIR